MLEHRGDMWLLAHQLKADAVCITTNGYVRRDGSAVLGRGCALEAYKRWPSLVTILGEQIKTSGVKVSRLTDLGMHRQDEGRSQLEYHLVAFPVKPAKAYGAPDRSNIVAHMRRKPFPGNVVPGCFVVAKMDIIERSCTQLMKLIEAMGWSAVLLPRPGCGAGGLDWDEVKPVIEPFLDDRVVVVTY